MQARIAILYQATAAPVVRGAVKPQKPGGYSDSGADIAYVLRARGIDVVTPRDKPDATVALDWVWPDTESGLDSALSAGASILWANTSLFSGHPVERLVRPVKLVGQSSTRAQQGDDKFATNAMLRSMGLPVTPAFAIAVSETGEIDAAIDSLTDCYVQQQGFEFPLVIKPFRGRGSQGVKVVQDTAELRNAARDLISTKAGTQAGEPLFGYCYMVEEYLPGEEITIAIMPPGQYRISGKQVNHEDYWALPPVRRFAHHDGIAPYNGVVAVVRNSTVLFREQAKQSEVEAVVSASLRAAQLVGALAPVRIDCRMSRQGEYKLFDLNMKPNMTGPGRPGRDDQDSLILLAARAIGWDFGDLLLNMLAQAWPLPQQPSSYLD